MKILRSVIIFFLVSHVFLRSPEQVFGHSQQQINVPFSSAIESEQFPKKNLFLILGAGPGGLVAAATILKTIPNSFVYMVEKRSYFSRYNQVNIFPESWAFLGKIGMNQAYSNVASLSDVFRFSFHFKGENPFNFSVDHEEDFEQVDFLTSPVSKLYEQPGVGLQVFDLASLQQSLLAELKKTYPNRFLIVKGEVDFQTPEEFNKNRVVTIKHDNLSENIKVQLTVFAEVAHSSSRKKLGIKMQQMLPTQRWCSGSVSLKKLWPEVNKQILFLDHQQVKSYPRGKF